jgi:hypothetical protein
MRVKNLLAIGFVLALSVISIFVTSSPALAQSVTISATSGSVDTVVSVTGSGFPANAAFQTYFAYGTTYQVTVDTGTVSSTGTLTTSFRIPSVPAGSYVVRVQTSTSHATTSFTVTSAISLNVSSSIVGNQVTITGTGFSSGRNVTIRFDNTQVATSSTNNAGRFSTSFNIPETYAGSHTITATDGVYTKTATLTIVQSMTISPTSGSVGTTVTVSGTGFVASRSIKISYDGTNIASVPSTITTNNAGSFSAKFTVPAGPARTVQVSASDGTNLASTSFKLIATIGLTPTTGKVGTPITIEGSGFNANRQVILTFDDYQVRQVSTDSLGSFTTNFDVPAAIGGQHPVTANDGVRSVSATFTVASNLVVTPNSGKVGTPVTVGGSGFRANRTINVYFDNFLLVTAHSNVSGSFSATFSTIVSTGGIHTISIDDGTYTASSTFVIQPSMTLDQTSGKMGTQVNITGTGFDAGRTLIIRLGTTQVRSTTTDANGSFSDRFTVPQMDVGSYNLNASDGVNMASLAFTVTTSFNISPTTGDVGSTVTVTGGGYSGLVTIKYDDNVVANAVANAEGSFSTTFTVPVSVHGYHTVTVSDTAATLQTTFSVESVPPPTPIVLAPQGIFRENARPTFTWQGVSDPSGVTYDLQIAGDANFSSIILEKSELATTQYNISRTEKLKATGKETPYYWRVKAVDQALNQSQWSTPGSFYVSFMADWLKYTLIGLGSLIGALLIFWLGMITGRRARQND